MKWKIPLFQSYWEEDDVEAVAKVIRRGSYWATGPETQQFEEELAAFVGTNYALVFNSGTSALHCMMISYGIKPGDEVIVPSFSFIATANAPLFVGAKPVFADVEPQTFGLDAADVQHRITKKTKAIMPIHYGGCGCRDIKILREIADDHNLILLEDAAQSLGGRLKNQMVGTFGDAAMFSLCQDKMITTGEGGIVVLNSRDHYEQMKLLRSHGRADTADYFTSSELMDYVSLGYNFRMPTMLCALGLSQLKKIKKTIQMRQKNAERYTTNLKKNPSITLPTPSSDYYHVYQKYTIQVDQQHRDPLLKTLHDNGVLAKSYFSQPIHQSKFYRDTLQYPQHELPVTEKLAQTVITLPMFPNLTQQNIDLITSIIHEHLQMK